MIKTGLFGIGLDTYWNQFEGLLDRLNGYQKEVSQRIEGMEIQVINAGMVDNSFKANEAAALFHKENVDALVLFISTYALSQNVLPIVQKIKVPLIVLNLQPEKAIDYKKFNAMDDKGTMTGDWLAFCQGCFAPELASVLKRAHIRFTLISGYLREEYVWKEVQEFFQAVEVVKTLQNNRVGLMGHYYNGMLDVYSDLTLQSVTFGNHFEILEFGTLKKIREEVSETEIEQKISEFNAAFDVSPDCALAELRRAAKTSVALHKLVDTYKLGSIAYYYEGDGDQDYKDIVSSLIPGLTLLTGKNVPVAGEYEVKNVQAMKILDSLACGGSFSEFYAMDYNEDIVLMGHDGPAHFTIAEGKVGLVPLPVFHGKPGHEVIESLHSFSGTI